MHNRVNEICGHCYLTFNNNIIYSTNTHPQTFLDAQTVVTGRGCRKGKVWVKNASASHYVHYTSFLPLKKRKTRTTTSRNKLLRDWKHTRPKASRVWRQPGASIPAALQRGQEAAMSNKGSWGRTQLRRQPLTQTQHRARASNGRRRPKQTGTVPPPLLLPRVLLPVGGNSPPSLLHSWNSLTGRSQGVLADRGAAA